MELVMFDVFDVENSNNREVVEGAIIFKAQQLVDDIVHLKHLTNDLTNINNDDDWCIHWNDIVSTTAEIAKLNCKLHQINGMATIGEEE